MERRRTQGGRRWRRKEEEGLQNRKVVGPPNNPWVEHSSTFFFSNFPEGHGEYDMFRIFQKWSRVKEVFIFRRLNRWGRRFGFVRFFPVSNEARLEKQLDQIYIGSLKLHVNLPKYRRAEAERKFVKPAYAHEDYRRASSPRGNKVLYDKAVRCENPSRSYRRGNSLKPKVSYAEVVRNSPQDLWKGPSIEMTPNTPSWFVSSAVGRMAPEVSFESLKEEFVKGGMSRIKLRFMGDNLVLLTPMYGERLEETIQLNNEWFGSLFISVEPWSETYVAGHKVVWVRCYGLPIPLWNKDCF